MEEELLRADGLHHITELLLELVILKSHYAKNDVFMLFMVDSESWNLGIFESLESWKPCNRGIFESSGCVLGVRTRKRTRNTVCARERTRD